MERIRNLIQNQQQQKATPDRVVRELNKEPKEPEKSAEESKREMQEAYEEYETAARKVCRLLIKAARETPKIRRQIIGNEKITKEKIDEIVKKIGKETPDIAEELNELEANDHLYIWAIGNANFLLSQNKAQEVEIE